MSVLDLLPASLKGYAAIGAALLAAGAVAGLAWWHHSAETAALQAADAAGYARGHAEWVALDAAMSRAALRAAEANAAETERRAAAQKEIEDAHQAELQRLRADAAIADAAAGRLRQRVADLIAAARSGQAGGDPAPVAGGPAAGDPAGMLADVLSRCVARVRFLAAVADERGAAGSACERAYDSLTPPEAEAAAASAP